MRRNLALQKYNLYIVFMMNLALILTMPDGVAKTAALVAWVQGLFVPGKEPVLVGGAAVELYTGGAYTAGRLVRRAARREATEEEVEQWAIQGP